ncbi:hypothetical protein [Methyloglobulus sp.]|uniref:hypothetical protein n=1 Tax=Methyloglobulus sp. TaxID=2518622 RepID=UPI003989A507
MPEQELTKLNLIRKLGDVITEIDVSRGSFPKKSAKRKELDSWRLRLDAKQHALTDAVFKEGTPSFKSAAEKIGVLSDKLNESIEDVNKTAQAFADLARLASAIDDLLVLAAGIVK